MKNKILIAVSAALVMAAPSFAQSAGKPVYKDAEAPVEKRVEDLLSRMTLEEKILQLNQYTLGQNTVANNIGEMISNVPAEAGSVIYFGDNAIARNAMQKKCMEESRLGIPMLFGHDVIHGYRTIYPIALGQAASFNPELSRQLSEVAAAEAYASGVDWTFSPMVDIARDPRWGRISEGYGEDPYTASVFSAATVRGYQGEDLAAPGTIAACLKHYVGYGASEAGRDYVPTEISRQTLWDTYLPSFEAGVKAGAATLMSAFNTISGIPASANHYTLTEVLKNKWGHEGFVVSDWDAVMQLVNQGMAENAKEAAMLAFNSGVEMDMHDDIYRKWLPELVEEGKVSADLIDESVRRVLRVKFQLGLFDNPYRDELPDEKVYLLPQTRALAFEAAAESAVLLKNSGVLPVKKAAKIALIGPLGDSGADLNGNWVARGKGSETVTLLAGIKNQFPKGTTVNYVKGCDYDGDDASGFAKAVAAAKASDVVIMALGEKSSWSGENASRSTIALPDIQIKLLEAVKAAGKPVVVLLGSGRSLDLSKIEPLADAMLEMWQPGTEGGNAIASLLCGKIVPSGKLPVTFPYTTGQIPIYYNHRASARRGRQGYYQDIQTNPMYEFGYGLSYTTFEYSDLQLSASEIPTDGKLTATVKVKNTGDVDAKETVHWYITDPFSLITRPVKELKFFEKRLIKAGETATFTFEIDPLRDLGFVDENGEKYLETGLFKIQVGKMTKEVTVK